MRRMTFASTSTFESAFASAPAYDRMDVDESEDESEDEDMFRCVETVIRQHTASKAAHLNGTCIMYWVKIDGDMYSLDLRRAKYLDRAMYEGGASPMDRGTWVFLRD